MKFGFAPLNNAGGVHPAALGRYLEERGFESVWMPEHSHIPTSRQTEYVAGGELPGGYYQMMNPFISLAAMIPTASALTLATGVAQPLPHRRSYPDDPVFGDLGLHRRDLRHRPPDRSGGRTEFLRVLPYPDGKISDLRLNDRYLPPQL